MVMAVAVVSVEIGRRGGELGLLVRMSRGGKEMTYSVRVEGL